VLSIASSVLSQIRHKTQNWTTINVIRKRKIVIIWSKISREHTNNGNAIMFVNVANNMCITRINYNAKELKLVTTSTPKMWLLRFMLGEMKLHYGHDNRHIALMRHRKTYVNKTTKVLNCCTSQLYWLTMGPLASFGKTTQALMWNALQMLTINLPCWGT